MISNYGANKDGKGLRMQNDKDRNAMSLEQLPDLYYTPEQARKKLGITRDAFNHYVKKGTIKKTTILGKHGHFVKRDIDLLAKTISSAMLAALTPHPQFRRATVDEQEDELELAVLTFGEKARVFHESRHHILLKNPETSYTVYEDKYMVACVNGIPLQYEGIRKFKEGEAGWLLEDYVEQFVPGKPLEIVILELMTTPLVSLNLRRHYAMHLLFGIAHQLTQWGRQGVDIVSIYAEEGTPTGKQLLEKAGFTSVAQRGNNRTVYQLNVKASNLHVLKPYKDALAKYQREHT